MEEPLKARLIGAAVLVTVAVLLIPELLSGRKAVEPAAEDGSGQRGARTFTIELGQGPGQTSRTAPATTAPAPVAAEETTAATGERPAPGVEPQPEAQAPVTPAAVAAQGRPVAQSPAPRPEQKAAAKPEPKPEPTAQPAATAGGAWAVQVGAFGSLETARGMVRDLTGAGYRAYIAPVTRGGKTLHRVRVGPEADRASAEQIAKRLKARGLPATVVRND
jgi:DedD protein